MSEPAAPGAPKGSRLAGERSSYLRSAVEQAIDWHPWGEEPFRKARESSRPILLDIGASWCHWCHVMDEGTYSDPEVARLLAEHFVAVKVDRDEHPEVDRRYQLQVHALTGEGGWPLTAFLTPDGTVFLGGTYFPPTDGHGRPGFRRVLGEVARVFREEPERVTQNTRALQDALGRIDRRRGESGADLEEFARTTIGQLSSSFDPVHGGFGGAPKFPHPTAVELLLWADWRGFGSTGSQARETLLRMADGGMYDQLGGGFHRYSVDEGWHVPHFEKMAVDNAELLSAYVAGFCRFGDARMEEVVRGTIGWVESVLADPAGGWRASQDADNAPGDDGDYFTWTRAEARGALDPQEFRLVARVFGLDTEGRMPHAPERNVLYRMLPVGEAAEGLALDRPPEVVFRDASEKLLRARARRPAPQVDPAVYASINGRFVGAFARAGAVFGETAWIASARRTADRFLAEGYDPRTGVAHQVGPSGARGRGLLEDQVAFASGLLDLSVASVERAYLDRALELLRLIDREFRGSDGLIRDLSPGLYDGPRVGGVLEPAYPVEDMPHLSGNSATALAFLRAAALTHDPDWLARARSLLEAIARRIDGAGLFAAGAAWGAGLASIEPASVIVEGEGDAADRLVRAAQRSYHPLSFVFRGRPPAPFSVPLPAADRSEAPRALVCFGSACAPPVLTEEELRGVLQRGRASP